MSALSKLWAKIKKVFKGTDYDKALTDAIENLKQDAPMVSAWLKELEEKGVKLTFSRATLKGDVEARTHIQEMSDPWIEVDTFKVINTKRDRLEPVIGHEIGHAYDAYCKYGVTYFISIVAKEATMPWAQRTVEKSAIERENEIRKHLLEDHFQEYKNMAPTRERQNQLAGHREFA